MHKQNPFADLLWHGYRDQKREMNFSALGIAVTLYILHTEHKWDAIESEQTKEQSWMTIMLALQKYIDGKKFKLVPQQLLHWSMMMTLHFAHVWKLIVLNASHSDLNLILLQNRQLFNYSFQSWFKALMPHRGVNLSVSSFYVSPMEKNQPNIKRYSKSAALQNGCITISKKNHWIIFNTKLPQRYWNAFNSWLVRLWVCMSKMNESIFTFPWALLYHFGIIIFQYAIESFERKVN